VPYEVRFIWENVESSILEQTSKEQTLSLLRQDANFSNFGINNQNRNFYFEFQPVTSMYDNTLLF
jgi:hypothetical protein